MAKTKDKYFLVPNISTGKYEPRKWNMSWRTSFAKSDCPYNTMEEAQAAADRMNSKH